MALFAALTQPKSSRSYGWLFGVGILLLIGAAVLAVLFATGILGGGGGNDSPDPCAPNSTFVQPPGMTQTNRDAAQAWLNKHKATLNNFDPKAQSRTINGETVWGYCSCRNSAGIYTGQGLKCGDPVSIEACKFYYPKTGSPDRFQQPTPPSTSCECSIKAITDPSKPSEVCNLDTQPCRAPFVPPRDPNIKRDYCKKDSQQTWWCALGRCGCPPNSQQKGGTCLCKRCYLESPESRYVPFVSPLSPPSCSAAALPGCSTDHQNINHNAVTTGNDGRTSYLKCKDDSTFKAKGVFWNPNKMYNGVKGGFDCKCKDDTFQGDRPQCPNPFSKCATIPNCAQQRIIKASGEYQCCKHCDPGPFGSGTCVCSDMKKAQKLCT